MTVRNIKTGTSEGDDTEIVAGLAAGDVVVLTGADKLQEGSKVNVQVLGEKPPPQQKGSGQTPQPGGKG